MFLTTLQLPVDSVASKGRGWKSLGKKYRLVSLVTESLYCVGGFGADVLAAVNGQQCLSLVQLHSVFALATLGFKEMQFFPCLWFALTPP